MRFRRVEYENSHDFHKITMHNFMCNFLREIESGADMSKIYYVIIAFLLSFALSIGFAPTSIATDSCELAGVAYVDALKSYQMNSNPTNDQYKVLSSLKKVADAQVRDCIKIINQDFKNNLKAINDKFPSGSKSKDAKLSQSTNKNSQIAAAIVLRDARIKEINSLPELPAKPVKSVNQKKKNR